MCRQKLDSENFCTVELSERKLLLFAASRIDGKWETSNLFLFDKISGKIWEHKSSTRKLTLSGNSFRRNFIHFLALILNPSPLCNLTTFKLFSENFNSYSSDVHHVHMWKDGKLIEKGCREGFLQIKIQELVKNLC